MDRLIKYVPHFDRTRYASPDVYTIFDGPKGGQYLYVRLPEESADSFALAAFERSGSSAELRKLEGTGWENGTVLAYFLEHLLDESRREDDIEERLDQIRIYTKDLDIRRALSTVGFVVSFDGEKEFMLLERSRRPITDVDS